MKNLGSRDSKNTKQRDFHVLICILVRFYDTCHTFKLDFCSEKISISSLVLPIRALCIYKEEKNLQLFITIAQRMLKYGNNSTIIWTI